MIYDNVSPDFAHKLTPLKPQKIYYIINLTLLNFIHMATLQNASMDLIYVQVFTQDLEILGVVY